MEWLVNSRLLFGLDAHSSTAESRPDGLYGSDNVIGAATWVRAETIAHFGEAFPVLEVRFPDGVTALDPADMRVTGSSFRNSMMKSEIDQLQFSGEFEFDGGQSIDFGVMHADVYNRSAFANVQRDTWGGVGDAGDFDNDFWIPDTVADKFSAPGSDNPRLLNEFFRFDFADIVARSKALYGDSGEGPVGDCGTRFCPSTDYVSQTDRRTREVTTRKCGIECRRKSRACASQCRVFRNGLRFRLWR